MPAKDSPETKFELVGEREHVMTRQFAGPAHLVFDIWTKPEHVKRWWTPPSTKMQMVECTIDLRVGGKYRFLARREGGFEVGFSGEYTEIEKPTKLVYTEIFDMAPDSPSVCTLTLVEQNGRTTLTLRSLFSSPMARTMACESGMESGVVQCMTQIDDILAALL